MCIDNQRDGKTTDVTIKKKKFRFASCLKALSNR